MLKRKSKIAPQTSNRLPEFKYIESSDIYMDSACQSMRPQPVIDALTEYYQTYNACGDRVKYKWGQEVDKKIEETRGLILDFIDFSKKDYACSFTLNTTYGLNLILKQLPLGIYQQVITSEIEHNSVFLSTIEFSKSQNIPRKILSRDSDGNLLYTANDLVKSVVVVNAVSNVDGQILSNIKQLVKDTHKAGGIVIIDAAQTMAHYHEVLSGCGADAVCFSAHKMYASSLGGIVISKKLLQTLNITFVGGGMVSEVQAEKYTLTPDDLPSRLEPGLQSYGEIISLNFAIKWLKSVKLSGQKPADYISKLSDQLFHGLVKIPGIIVLNKKPSSVISLYSEKIDSHRLAIFLSSAGIMVRSGYFCCHYYLINTLKLPPLVRFSIGLQTTEQDIEKVLETINKLQGIK